MYLQQLVIVLLLPLSIAIPLSEFFDFNTKKLCSISTESTSVNDYFHSSCEEILLPRSTDAEILYDSVVEFPFFDETVTKIYANVNGLISFQQRVEESFPVPIPTKTMVSAFWNKIDTTGSSDANVFFRPSTKYNDLKQASMEIRDTQTDMKEFDATWVLVVTWYKVAYYSQGNKHNTFQMVLVTDGVDSFVINNYEDDGIHWSSVQPNGTGNGLDGIHAQAGFSDGSGVNYFNIPGSNTPMIISIASTSNVNVPGMWILRLTYPLLELRPFYFIQKLGAEILLNCTPSDHISEIGWLKDDVAIDGNNNGIQFLPSSSLKHILYIASANYLDNGTYVCGLDKSGKLTNSQKSDVTVLKDGINVYTEDGKQLVTNAIINSFSTITTGTDNPLSNNTREIRSTSTGNGNIASNTGASNTGTTGSGSGSGMMQSTTEGQFKRSVEGDEMTKGSMDIDHSQQSRKEFVSVVAVTTNGNEGVTWSNSIISGDVIIENNPGTEYVAATEAIMLSDKFTFILNCSTTQSNVISAITVTTEKPFVKALSGSFIKAKLGSTPNIEYMIAVESDGVTEFHTSIRRYLTFSFTNIKLVTTYLPIPRTDPDNFQQYVYTLPPVETSSTGNYTLKFYDPLHGHASASVAVEATS